MPITAFFTRMKLPFKIFLLVLLFGLAPILRANLGYAEKPSFPPLWQDGHFVPFEGVFIVILKHWLIDGWFPIFSWLGILFIGALLAELRLTKKNLSKKNYGIVFLFGLFFLGIGIAFWNQEFRLLARGNYTEMFYPPTLSYYSAYFGGILLLYLLVEMNSNLVIYTPLRLLGVSSLFFYFTHFLVISKFIEPYYGHVPDSDINFLNLQDFLITFFILILFCLFLALILFLIKKRFSNLPFLVKFFIGG
jgi:hypothetical protein